MNKIKKAAAVAVMAGGMALGGGAAHAAGGHGLDDPAGVIIGNLQTVNCHQEFEGGAAFAPVQGASTEGNTQNIGSFCTVVGPVYD
ncbi:hypothetical protein AB0D78_41195 [Streptomyces avermitilis]|uniref:hypothetical protein n=1 Tax=Streptomyces avermitilis TaxID=33903 RepID=UPI00339F17BA